MPEWASFALDGLFAVLFPGNCRICNDPLIRISRLPVCQQCLDAIEPVSGNLCSVCGERALSPYAVNIGDEAFQCSLCRRAAPPFVKAVAYGSYETGLRELVHMLKYAGVLPAAKVLGQMLAAALVAIEPSMATGATLVIPVPLHKRKRRQRGFNQSELIARAALKFYPVVRFRLATNILLRQRETQSQIGLTSHQRRENMRGAFAVARAEEVNGREVLLVDDVYTTGTTVSECARVLRRAGASRVWVATAARTLKLASNYVVIRPGEASAENDVKATELASAVGN